MKQETPGDVSQTTVSSWPRPHCADHGARVKREPRCRGKRTIPTVPRAAVATPSSPHKVREHVSPVGFELQERGMIRLGLLLTREGDEKMEFGILKVTDVRRRDIQITSQLTGEREVWTRA